MRRMKLHEFARFFFLFFFFFFAPYLPPSIILLLCLFLMIFLSGPLPFRCLLVTRMDGDERRKAPRPCVAWVYVMGVFKVVCLTGEVAA